MMSRINNFSKMFLISESYYNDLKNKNGEEEEQATTMEEIPIPPTDIISSPSPLINDNDGNVENDDDDDDDDDDDVGDNFVLCKKRQKTFKRENQRIPNASSGTKYPPNS